MALAQLVFEPAYDPYHTMFRMQRLSRMADKAVLEVDRVRIADFYSCFPILVDQFRHRRGEAKFRAISRTARVPYSGIPDGRLVFTRMQPTQSAALRTLGSAGYICADKLQSGLVQFEEKAFPVDILHRIERLNVEEPLLTDFLSTLLNDFPLDGKDGLKHRSALLDHRYDAV